jgi:hypothetical protein
MEGNKEINAKEAVKKPKSKLEMTLEVSGIEEAKELKEELTEKISQAISLNKEISETLDRLSKTKITYKPKSKA